MTVIRPARTEDASAIGRIHVDTWRDTYAGMLPDRVLVEMSSAIEGGQWARVLDSGRDRVVVADSETAGVVGFGSCGKARAGALGFEGEVYTLYVLPDFQGQGLGRLLLTELFQQLQADGYRSALVWVLQENPAGFFYEAMGGRPAASRTERLWGADVAERAYGWDDLDAATTGSVPK